MLKQLPLPLHTNYKFDWINFFFVLKIIEFLQFSILFLQLTSFSEAKTKHLCTSPSLAIKEKNFFSALSSAQYEIWWSGNWWRTFFPFGSWTATPSIDTVTSAWKTNIQMILSHKLQFILVMKICKIILAHFWSFSSFSTTDFFVKF